MIINYRSQMKFAKVMFLHLSVSHSDHRGGDIPACIAGGIPACLAGLQAHTQGGSWEFGLEGLQAHTWGGGVSRPDTTQQMTTAAGGTHPTGMHSC